MRRSPPWRSTSPPTPVSSGRRRGVRRGRRTAAAGFPRRRDRRAPGGACAHAPRAATGAARAQWLPARRHGGRAGRLHLRYGCIASLPEGANGFTTIELKTNFLATALEGTIHAESRLIHGGRTTQIWDATVTRDDGKTLALFRCTQLLLY